MAIYRAQITFPVDGVLPADAMTITPHYQGDDAQGLADRLKTNLTANTQIGATKPFTVRIYDAQKAPPSYPLATASQSGTPPTSPGPRELALCLSFYSTFNRPSYRGRLYIPHTFLGGVLTSRPSTTQRDAAMAWGPTLSNGLPTQTTWSVYSRKLGQAFTISDYWVDDEWDVVRSRGRKPTTRNVGTVP